MNWDAFFTVHQDLPREGPGLPDDVHWALGHFQSPPARVLDAACGPGADTETLAQVLPDAQIDACEMQQNFVDQAKSRCAPFGARVQVSLHDMADMPGPYDLIWCAGAVYFLGIPKALAAWRPALTGQGMVTFSEPVLEPDAPEAAKAFWAGEGDVSDTATVLAQVKAAGFEVVATRKIVGAAWQAYYVPMEARIASLRAAGVTQDVEAACAEAEREISLWRAAPDDIAYLLIIAKPAA